MASAHAVPPDDHRFACVSLVPIFADLSEGDRREIARMAQIRRFEPDDTVQHPGERSGLLIVHSGRVRLSRISESGAEQLLRMLGPGDFLGELAVLTGRVAEARAEALGHTTVCVLRREGIDALLGQRSGVAVRMPATMAARLDEAERQLSAVTGASVGKRLADYLLGLATEAGSGRFRLPSTKKDVASYLGTTPETLSRRLAALQDAGVVRLGPRGVVEVLDAEGLRRDQW